MSLSNGRAKPLPSHLFLFLLFIARFIDAQPPSNEIPTTTNNNAFKLSSGFNPYTAIIIVLLVTSFFFLAFFSIYIRTCNHGPNDNSSPAAETAAGFIRFQRGLNPHLLQTFPTLMYSEVKPHKIERSELECAICLNEFDEEDIIRLLPACDHVFHLDCIDAWLATHVTCPVCRTNYNLYSAPPETIPHPDAEAAAAHHVAIAVDDMEGRKEEMRELAVLASKVRRNGARRSKRLSRSHSTGHLVVAEGEASFNRYTLRLPENLRKEIIAAGSLRKARTFTAAASVGEGSMRKDSRGVGEGSSRRGRTIHLGRSDRWPSFFGRSLSARLSTFGKGRKGEEGGVKESP